MERGEIKIVTSERTYNLNHGDVWFSGTIGEPMKIECAGFLSNWIDGNGQHPKKAVFHNPATVVYWTDGTKTVVKCQPGDEYDPMTGFLLCVAKKFFGNKGAYNKVIQEFVKEEDDG